MIKAFLFDLDGVITDTSEYHFIAWRRLANELGIPFTRAENEALRGISRRESLAKLLKGRQVSEEQAQSYMQRKNTYYLELIHKIEPQNILPGALEMLAEIRKMGLRTAIVSTSKNARLVIEKLQIGGWIDTLVDGYSPGRPKPSPDAFLLAAEFFQLDPEECLVIEDAAAGIEAAHAAGMPAVGLGTTERVGAAEIVLPSLEGVSAHQILEKLQAL